MKKNDGFSKTPALWIKTLPQTRYNDCFKRRIIYQMNLPLKIDNHSSVFSKKEVDHYQSKGKGIHLITLSPIRKQGDLYTISSSTFGYNRQWRTFGESDYTFHYDLKNTKIHITRSNNFNVIIMEMTCSLELFPLKKELLPLLSCSILFTESDQGSYISYNILTVRGKWF